MPPVMGSKEFFDAVFVIAEPLIKHFENCHLKQYICPAGKPTIGWGRVIRDGQYPYGISQAQADHFFVDDFTRCYNEVMRILNGRNANVNDVAAFVSFAYNCGFGQWPDAKRGIKKVDGFRTSTLLQLYKQGKRKEAAAQFDRWVHGGGKELPGLVRRRKCERFIFEQHTIDELKKHDFFIHEAA